MPKKAVLITGGTGNLGIHLARDFIKSGWDVAITSRHQKNAQMASDIIRREAMGMCCQWRLIWPRKAALMI